MICNQASSISHVGHSIKCVYFVWVKSVCLRACAYSCICCPKSKLSGRVEKGYLVFIESCIDMTFRVCSIPIEDRRVTTCTSCTCVISTLVCQWQTIPSSLAPSWTIRAWWDKNYTQSEKEKVAHWDSLYQSIINSWLHVVYK